MGSRNVLRLFDGIVVLAHVADEEAVAERAIRAVVHARPHHRRRADAGNRDQADVLFVVQGVEGIDVRLVRGDRVAVRPRLHRRDLRRGHRVIAHQVVVIGGVPAGLLRGRVTAAPSVSVPPCSCPRRSSPEASWLLLEAGATWTDDDSPATPDVKSNTSPSTWQVKLVKAF